MWSTNQTCPDLVNAVRAVARYSHSLETVLWKPALHILRNITLTSGLGVTFQRVVGSGGDLELCVDSDVASRDFGRRSVSEGFVM